MNRPSLISKFLSVTVCMAVLASVVLCTYAVSQPKTLAFDYNQIGPGRPQGPTSLSLRAGDSVVIYAVSDAIYPGMTGECHISEIKTTDGKPDEVLTLDRSSCGTFIEPGKIVLYRLEAARPGTAQIVLGSISEASVTIDVRVK